jgi:hypothetical protein
MPFPDKVIIAGELDALLLTVTLPVAAPLADGANVDVSVVDCPGERIVPVDPVELKPAPATKTWEMVTLDLPALVKVTFCVPLLATFTSPKFKLLALEFSNRVAAEGGVATLPHPTVSKNKEQSEAIRVFFLLICTVWSPFRSRTGHPLKPACVVCSERYGRGSDAVAEYVAELFATTGRGSRMSSVSIVRGSLRTLWPEGRHGQEDRFSSTRRG